jgi:O-antigen/teichoic acid export membrane protein
MIFDFRRFRLKAARHQVAAVTQYVVSTGTLIVGLGSQLVAFIVLARYLGTSQFGQLMTILAATSLAAQICGIGCSEAMIRRVARKPASYPAVLGHSLILILSSGIALTLLTAFALVFFIHATANFFENLGIVLIFAFSNIVLFQWIALTESIFLARHQLMHANMINAGFAVWRSVATLLACVAFGVDQLESWAVWYGFIHLIGGVACIAAVWQYGAPQWRVLREEIRLGFHFTTPLFLDALRQNVDLLALNGVVTTAAIGLYSAASRIVLTSLVTVNSFYRLLYPHLSVAGQRGASTTFRLAVRYVILATGLSAATSLALFIVAPYLAILFGKDFGDMVLYIRVLCWLLILVAIKNAAYDALGAAEKHGIRAAVYNTGVIVSAILIVGLTRLYGLPGTFAALFISHALVAVSLWITLFALSRRETRLDLKDGRLNTSSELEPLL